MFHSRLTVCAWGLLNNIFEHLVKGSSFCNIAFRDEYMTAIFETTDVIGIAVSFLWPENNGSVE